MNATAMDHKATLALVSGAAAGLIGVVFGKQRQAAAVAAISSIAGSVLADQFPKDYKKNPLRKPGSVLVVTCLLFLTARAVGQKMSENVAVAGLAGACGAMTFYKPKSSEKFESLPFLLAMGFSMVSAHLFPTHKPTLANALLLLTATNLAARELKEHVATERASIIECGRALTPLFLSTVGKPIGFPIRWRQVVGAIVIVDLMPALSDALIGTKIGGGTTNR